MTTKRIVRSTAMLMGALILTTALARADGDGPKATESGSVRGAIVRTFPQLRLVEVKIERVREPKGPDDAKEPEKAANAPCPGEVIFVDVSHARVVDDEGYEMKNDLKSAWFTKDSGWAILKIGRRVKVDYEGTREFPPPKSLSAEGAKTGSLLVYCATCVTLRPPFDPAAMLSHEVATIESATVEGAVVHLFSKEKLIELEIDRLAEPPRQPDGDGKDDTARRPALRTGEVIFVQVADACVFDERGTERKREDKAHWFSTDEGWSILKEGCHVRVDTTSTVEMPSPKDCPRAASSGNMILAFRAMSLRFLADTK